MKKNILFLYYFMTPKTLILYFNFFSCSPYVAGLIFYRLFFKKELS